MSLLPGDRNIPAGINSCDYFFAEGFVDWLMNNDIRVECISIIHLLVTQTPAIMPSASFAVMMHACFGILVYFKVLVVYLNWHVVGIVSSWHASLTSKRRFTSYVPKVFHS